MSNDEKAPVEGSGPAPMLIGEPTVVGGAIHLPVGDEIVAMTVQDAEELSASLIFCLSQLSEE